MFKHKGSESPDYCNNSLGYIYNNQNRSSEMSNSGNNLKYTNLKNYNWIKEQIGENSMSYQNYGRPWGRGGKQDLDSSFQERSCHQDLAGDRSYFDR